MGFDLERFPSEEIGSELICSICAGVLEKPLETSCQHLFCGECIQKWLSKRKSCPHCRKNITTADLRQVLPALKKILNKQKINCEYKSNGCKELVTIETLPKHLSSCSYVSKPSLGSSLAYERNYDPLDLSCSQYSPLTVEPDDQSDVYITTLNGSKSNTYFTASLRAQLNSYQNKPEIQSQYASYENAVMETTRPGTIRMVNINNEDEELELCKRHKRYLDEALNTKLHVWISKRDNVLPHVSGDMGLFLARYSQRLGLVVACNSCNRSINEHQYRCLNCLDVDLCSTCYSTGKITSEHRICHTVLGLKMRCNECNAYIIQTYYHCEVCKDFDLCLDCYRTGKFPSCHRSSHAMTKGRLSSYHHGNITRRKSYEENAELAMYERHRNYHEQALQVTLSVWLKLLVNATSNIKRDMNFFLARYAFNLGCTSSCDSCKREITRRHFRCLNCISLDLCESCFMGGKYPSKRCRKESHQIIELSVRCDGCSAYIIQTRYKCCVCSDFDLCLYCYKNNCYPPRHRCTHKMTKTNLLPGGMPYKIFNGS